MHLKKFSVSYVLYLRQPITPKRRNKASKNFKEPKNVGKIAEVRITIVKLANYPNQEGRPTALMCPPMRPTTSCIKY